MRILLRLIIALVLAYPLYVLIGLSITDWFVYGDGWSFFWPWLDFISRFGFRTAGDNMLALLFLLSFIIAFTAIILIEWIVRRLWKRRTVS